MSRSVMPHGSHPSEESLFEAAAGRAGQDATAARAHASSCPDCRDTLALLETVAAGVRELAALDQVAPSPGPASTVAPGLSSAFSRVEAARANAALVLEAASRETSALEAAISGLTDDVLSYTLIYACQGAARHVAEAPGRHVEIARVVRRAAEREAAPRLRQRVAAEAWLLECQALHCLGRTDDARQAVHRARDFFQQAGGEEFDQGLCDYFEGYCASFQRDYQAAERLLRRARATFARYGQEPWIGRALNSYATLLAQKGSDRDALPLYDQALERLDVDIEPHVCAGALLNKASSLAHLGRLDEAHACYARALRITLKHDLHYYTHLIRNGLAEIDFRKGDVQKALRSFLALADRARAEGLVEDLLFAQLYVAECLGRLGRDAEMKGCIESLRTERATSIPGAAPAFEELFTCLDRGDLEAGLIEHVRTYLDERPLDGTLAYRPFRRAGSRY